MGHRPVQHAGFNGVRAMRLLPGTIDKRVPVAMATTRVWFKLQGAASADYVLMPTDALVADLREKIDEKRANRLREVDAADLILSTIATNADGKTATYDRASAPVSVVGATTEDAPLIVTSALTCLACCAPAADARRSWGPTLHHGWPWPGSSSGPCR
jgi:hypothetical protein